MTEATKQSVNPSSPEFKKGVEAGLNSSEDTKNWKAGNELGQELKSEGEDEKPASESHRNASSTPLFASRNPGGNQGNAQDEKDETEE
jgi:hypothetical protein